MVQRMTEDEWQQAGQKHYGEDKEQWIFQCPNCGHTQSVEGVMERHPDMDKDDVKRSINKNCETRFAGDPGSGCGLGLGAVDEMPGVIVEGDNGEEWACFAFDYMDQQQNDDGLKILS